MFLFYHLLFHPLIVDQAWRTKGSREQTRALFVLYHLLFRSHIRSEKVQSLSEMLARDAKCPIKSTYKLRTCNIRVSVCVRVIFPWSAHLRPAFYVIRCTLQFDLRHLMACYVKAYGLCFEALLSCSQMFLSNALGAFRVPSV